MNRLIFLLVIVVVCRLAAMSHTISGTIVDTEGKAVPFAAIYFKELRRGVSADAEGRFSCELPAGEHDCSISSLGYEGIEVKVDMACDTTRSFTLNRRPLALAEVTVTADGNEDPAYGIIRRVIARAPYYECMPDTFAARVYVKGSGKVTDVPGIFNMSADFRKEKDKIVNRLFVLEKVSEVEFGAPNRWNEHVEAESNTFPRDMTIDVPVSLTNFYGSNLFGVPSPLRQGAFTYYKYKLADRYEEGGAVINKINIEPRHNENGLFSGVLYIVENEWCLSAADLTMQQGGLLDMRVIATFHETEPGVWLLGSQATTCHVGVLGMKIAASYTLSAEYSHIGISATRRRGEIIPLTERGSGIAEEIERIEAKGNLSKADSYRLSALTSQLVEENLIAQKHIKKRSKYDLTYRLGVTNSTTDSLAGSRDSSYWAAMRSVPLDDEEMESYRRYRNDADSLQTDTVAPDWSDQLGNIMFGGDIYHKKWGKSWFKIGGLWSIWSGYNFVDGYKLGLGFGMGHDFNDAISLTVEPSAYYNTARKVVTGNVDARLDYAPLRSGRLSLSGGRVSADYNTEYPESATIIAIQSAIFARNDVKLYDKAYVSLSNDIEIANGTRLMTGLSWERRRPLDNYITQSWFKKAASPNVPANSAFTPMPTVSEALTATAAITFTPAAYYYVIDGHKRYLPSHPHFTVAYTRGFGFKDNSPSYNLVEVGVEHEIELGIFNKIIYQVRGGMFFGASGMQFPDFKHFSATRFPLTTHSFSDSFVLLDNYAYSTDDRYAEAGFTWQSPRMLLKQLPMLRNKNFSECLHLRSVVVRHQLPYSELGYSINILDLISVGVFTSWNGIDYRSTCASVSLPFKW